MSQPRDFDPASLLLGYTTGELNPAEERALLEAAAVDQDLFDHLVEADAARLALSDPEERRRASAVLKAWESAEGQSEIPAREEREIPPAPLPWPHMPDTVRDTPMAGAAHRDPPALLGDFLRSLVSTIATALALRLCYGLITSVGSSLLLPQVEPGQSPPVPSILHLVQAAIAALLLAIQFTPFLKPQAIVERDHPIARKCLAQFIAGWQCTWAAWLALYCWLWVHPWSGAGPDVVADILNCLSAFPLFWCFFVLDKPSVTVPGDPGRTASFRRAIGTTWGIGAGVVLLAVAGRLHLWGLNEFGLVFSGIYDGLSIAFLVGRFDSHWMKVPRWMLAPLYGYALIQMIYVFFFTLPPAWQIYTYLVALLFKVCLFLVVTHLLHAGNLRRYLEAAEDGNLGPRPEAG